MIDVETIFKDPGEAEAELAMLNRFGAIDAVLTSDSDCIVFGAHCILRRYCIQRLTC